MKLITSAISPKEDTSDNIIKIKDLSSSSSKDGNNYSNANGASEGKAKPKLYEKESIKIVINVKETSEAIRL